MPPKRGKKGAQEEASPIPNVARPSTPNDFQIAATVKSLQHLVNTEVKWKNRITEAQTIKQVAANKAEKIRGLIATCQTGISHLNKELDDLIAAMAVVPKPEPVPGAAGSSKKHKNDEDQIPAATHARRAVEAEAIGSVLRVFYNARHLSSDPPVERPTSQMEMAHEFDEAVRLSTPIAELLEQQAAKNNNPKAKSRAAAAAKDRKISSSPEAISTDDISAISVDPQLPMPLPRALHGETMQQVLSLRAKRLRLQASIDIFERELKPLRKRLEGVDHMTTLGNYSITAVQPKIHEAIEEEAALQKIRAKEDEAFVKSRASEAHNTSTTSRDARGSRHRN